MTPADLERRIGALEGRLRQLEERADLQPVRHGKAGAGGASVEVFPALLASGSHTDAQYDFAEVEDTSESGALSLSLKEDGRTGTCHHLTEHGVGNGFHGIYAAPSGVAGPARYVLIWGLDFGNGKRYVFESYPGQIISMYAFKVSCLDEDGCPEGTWYQCRGPSFQAQTDPPDCG